MINEYVSEICHLLNIPKPQIIYDTSLFPTKTTLAQCKSDGAEIYLKKFDSPNLDQCVAIAHELRHVWQVKTDKEKYLSNYQTIDAIGDTEKYNLQLAEIDANAFAKIVVSDCFHVKPLFNGLSAAVKIPIDTRIHAIIKYHLF